MSFLDSLHPLFRAPGDAEPNVAYFIAQAGEEGERWVREYTSPRNVDLMAGANRALEALRDRRMAEGERELLAVERLFRASASTAAPDVHHILGRWYYGLLAYYLYCVEDFAGADEALDCGHAEVQEAIEAKRLLLPYAVECYEFWIQRIRIARKQRSWPELWRRVEVTRQTALDERPCCVLADGTALDFAAVQAFYLSLAELTEAERYALRRILDPAVRIHHFRMILSEIYNLSGFVIPYTPTRPLVQEAAP